MQQTKYYSSEKMESLSHPSYRIVAIIGERIRPEVVEASLKILQYVAKLKGFSLQVDYAWQGRSDDIMGKNYLTSPIIVDILAVKGKISHNLE
ncbi:MAG: hypothetical protein PUP91_35930 [Rhizonema sp. PD37]|nr:hypothetical protein [Rhizonema sp. PD37]